MCDTLVMMWHAVIHDFSLRRADCNTEDGSVDGDTGLCGEGQPDFRSILSYGVQEPWVKQSASLSVTQAVTFPVVQRSEFCRF